MLALADQAGRDSAKSLDLLRQATRVALTAPDRLRSSLALADRLVALNRYQESYLTLWNIGLDADALWSVYDYKFLSHNIGGKLWDLRGDRLLVEYRYTRDSDEINLNEAKSIFGDLRVKVTNRLRLSGLYEYNFLDKTRVQTGFGLNYRADCWSFEGNVVDKVNVDNTSDLNWEFTIRLFGLGEFGI